MALGPPGRRKDPLFVIPMALALVWRSLAQIAHADEAATAAA